MIGGIDAFTPGFLANLSNIENRLAKENNEVSSGIRVNEPSDDPGAVAAILDTQNQIEQVTQAQKNLNAANVTAQTADGALQNASSLIDQLVSIASQGSSSTTNATSEAALALQVQNIQQELVSIANTSINGQYIFAGDNLGVAPYTLNLLAPDGVVAAPAQLRLTGNLDSGSPSFSQNVTVADSLGQTHTLTIDFTQASATTWNYQVTIPAADLSTSQVTASVSAGSANVTVANTAGIQMGQTVTGTGIPAGTTVQSITGNTVTLNNNATSGGTVSLGFAPPASGAVPLLATPGTLTFNAGGTLSSTTASPETIDLGNLLDGAENMSVDWSLFGADGQGLITLNAAASSLSPQVSYNTNTSILRDSSGNSIVPGMLASQIFGPQNGAAGSGVFGRVYALWQALESGNQTAIQNAALNLKPTATQISQASTTYGDLENWIGQANQDASKRLTNLQSLMSTLRDADIPSLATQLTMDETALQAAISAHAMLSHKTLFDYLG